MRRTTIQQAVEYHRQGKFARAEELYRQILRTEPGHADALHLLGVIYGQTGRFAKAQELIERAIARRPNEAGFQNSLGNVLAQQGKKEQAVACFRRVSQLAPDFVEVHNNLGNALYDLGRLEEAVACYRHVLRLRPDFFDAHNNLGNALREQKQILEAIACHRRTLQLRPGDRTVLGQLILEQQEAGLWDGLEELSRQAIHAVEADAASAGENVMPPFVFLVMTALPTTAKGQLLCARKWGERLVRFAKDSGWRRPFAKPHGADRRIAVGYLSAEFHEHATAYLMAELFEVHDRRGFEVVGYSIGSDDGSAMRRRLVGAFDRFVDLREASFLDSAKRIAEDGIDILVDLKGYTRFARSEIFALRPAPIQVNYLGYPGTMGTEFMDYALVDDFVVGPDQQPFFTEKLVHLPGCYQVNDSHREIASHTPTRAKCGLGEKGFVFCCFNNTSKIGPGTFDIWMRLLKAVPDSVLWLLEKNSFVGENLRRECMCGGCRRSD